MEERISPAESAVHGEYESPGPSPAAIATLTETPLEGATQDEAETKMSRTKMSETRMSETKMSENMAPTESRVKETKAHDSKAEELKAQAAASPPILPGEASQAADASRVYSKSSAGSPLKPQSGIAGMARAGTEAMSGSHSSAVAGGGNTLGPGTVLGGSSQRTIPVQLSREGLSNGALVIREFRPSDSEQVKAICFDHFRSSSLAAVRYHIAAHIQDLAFLVVMGLAFVPFRRVVLMVLLFHSYLFLKARWEMEQYIRFDCADLLNVYNTYMAGGSQSRFWVAELAPLNDSSSYSASNEGDGGPLETGGRVETGGRLVGCVGLVPSRENASIAKLVRLMVDRKHRRMKIGSRLLLQLEDYAKNHGFASVRIYTNTLNPSHMRFVRQHAYTVVQTIRRGLMRGDLITWHKQIGPSHQPKHLQPDAINSYGLQSTGLSSNRDGSNRPRVPPLALSAAGDRLLSNGIRGSQANEDNDKSDVDNKAGSSAAPTERRSHGGFARNSDGTAASRGGNASGSNTARSSRRPNSDALDISFQVRSAAQTVMD